LIEVMKKENASDSIRLKCDGDSNEIDESDPHNRKQDGPRISTLHGIIIDRRLENEKAKDSIRINLESRSNEIEWNFSSQLKHSTGRIEIDARTQARTMRADFWPESVVTSIKPSRTIILRW
jgi:hypothetical protein